MSALPLLDWTPPTPQGETFDEKRDGARLCAQGLRVFSLMRDGEWRTLEQISAATGDPQASVSARLRDIRRTGYAVNRKHVARGLWTYSVTQAEESAECAISSSSVSAS